jgi:hypothetical protein
MACSEYLRRVVDDLRRFEGHIHLSIVTTSMPAIHIQATTPILSSTVTAGCSKSLKPFSAVFGDDDSLLTAQAMQARGSERRGGNYLAC